MGISAKVLQHPDCSLDNRVAVVGWFSFVTRIGKVCLNSLHLEVNVQKGKCDNCLHASKRHVPLANDDSYQL